jgi:hypothetical protein
MKVVLVGSDFMYNSKGDLVPIGINTNVTMNESLVDNSEEIFDLNPLKKFIHMNGFLNITYIGCLYLLNTSLIKMCKEIGIPYRYIYVDDGFVTPDFTLDDKHLVIRSAYDGRAIVDDIYCRENLNFIKLIKNQKFSSQFAYINEKSELVTTIRDIKNNGKHPNFILKSNLPHYDNGKYPRFFKVESPSDLKTVYDKIRPNYFLMEFHLNMKHLYNNKIQTIRSFDIYYPPSLNCINIGQTIKLNGSELNNNSIYDVKSFELISDRSLYLSNCGVEIKPSILII